MAGNARFHDKLHRKNHHTSPTVGYSDSATDPIASHDNPFMGDFVVNGILSSTQGLSLLSADITNDVICENILIRDTLLCNFISGGETETIISDGALTGYGNFTLTMDYRQGIYAKSPIFNVTDVLSVVGNIFGNNATVKSLVVNGNTTTNGNSIINGDILITGNLSALGDLSLIETNIVATSAFVISNHNDAIALTIEQDNNLYEIATFKSNGNKIVSIENTKTTIVGDLSVTGTVNGSDIKTIQDNLNLVSNTSSNWNDVYNKVSETSGNWNDSYSLGVLFSSNSANYDRIYNEAFTIGSTPAISGWNSTTTTVINTSSNWESVYNIVSSNSAGWEGIYNSVNSNSGKWNNTTSVVNSNSSSWDSSYTTSNSYSSLWNDSYTTVAIGSAKWNNVFTTSNSNSSNWNTSYSIITSNSSNWNNSYNSVSTSSAKWNNSFTTVNAYSAGWGSVYTTLNSNSSLWDENYTVVRDTSGTWSDVYTSVNGSSAIWNSSTSALTSISSVYTTTNNYSSNWDSSYTFQTTNSARINNTYNTVNAYSANWQSSYSLIQSNQSLWLNGGNDVDASYNKLKLYGALHVSVTSVNTPPISSQLTEYSPSYWFVNTSDISAIKLNLPNPLASNAGIIFYFKNTYTGLSASDLIINDYSGSPVTTLKKVGQTPNLAQVIWDGTQWQIAFTQ